MPATDLLVVLPGILGSTLCRDGHLVWAPSAGSALRAIGTFGASIQRLQLPGDVGDDHPGDGVESVAIMPDLHVLPRIWTPVKGYDRLLARLRSLGYCETAADPGAPPGNLLPFAYDWRLSCRYNAQRLGRTVEPALQRWRAQGDQYTDARVTFVCHSMGGLIARWYIEKCGGAEITRKLITLGTPYRGSAKAVDQLVNESRKGLGRFGINLTDFARSMPSLYQLLPEYACIDQPAGLAKTTEFTLPGLETAKIADAMRFHTTLSDTESHRPESLAATHAIVGVRQATATTVRITGGRAEMINCYQREELFGDGTVPIVAACRPDVTLDSNVLRRIPDKHGNLQRNAAALDEVEGILTSTRVEVRAARPIDLQVNVPELTLVGEDINIEITPAEPTRHAVQVSVISEKGRLVESRILRPSRGTMTTTISDLAPGAYTITVTGSGMASPYAPVSSDVLIWQTPEQLLPDQ